MPKAEIYSVTLNPDTMNYGGLEYVIDGSAGKKTYPGSWAECTARTYYRNGYPVNKPVNMRTYTVKLAGKFYACAMELFIGSVWGIGQDEGKVATRKPGAPIPRNEMILEVCTPYENFKDAYNVALDAGIYGGMLYPCED